MSRIFTILFLLNLTTLSGQIYTQEVSPQQGGVTVPEDMLTDLHGNVHLAYFEYVPIYPNSTITAPFPWLSRFDPQLNLDTIAQPLDSLPITSQHLTPLKNGELLLGFSGGGFNGYNWQGNSYAILDEQYRPFLRAYDTSSTIGSFHHTSSVDDSTILAIVNQNPQADSLKLVNAYTGKTLWSVPRMPTLPFTLSHIDRSYSSSDSLRVFLNITGSGLPFPRWNMLLHMVTLDRATGAVGVSQQMPDSLISHSWLKSSQEFGLLYLDNTRKNLTYQRRNSNWQVLNSFTIKLPTLLSQMQLQGYRILSEPQVLKNGSGIGFLIGSNAVASTDTIYYLRLSSSGQIKQLERLDSLPAIQESRSYAGPQGGYFSTFEHAGRSTYILKAQPRHRISLPAPEAMAENLQVSPLPASDQLQVKLPAGTGQASHSYRLYGLTGQMYQRGRLAFSGGEATLDLHELPKGSYILVLETGEKPYRARVVVSP